MERAVKAMTWFLRFVTPLAIETLDIECAILLKLQISNQDTPLFSWGVCTVAHDQIITKSRVFDKLTAKDMCT